MTRILDIRQSALSHHLKILATSGLVSTRREYNHIFYTRGLLNTEDPFYGLKDSLFSTIDRLPLPENHSILLNQIKSSRAQQSLDFFNKFADKFTQDEDLVADSQQYASSLTDLLKGLMLGDKTTVLEVGPGEGNLLPLLANDFSNIIALDKSSEMIKKSRLAAEAKGIINVDYVLGNTTDAVSKGIKANLIVVSMVLHHVKTPLSFLKDLTQIIEKDGVVLIIELCQHNQEWLKETRGDLWLGFEPEELTAWAEKAGFSDGQSQYLGLRNGFQIQMRLFHKLKNTH